MELKYESYFRSRRRGYFVGPFAAIAYPKAKYWMPKGIHRSISVLRQQPLYVQMKKIGVKNERYFCRRRDRRFIWAFGYIVATPHK